MGIFYADWASMFVKKNTGHIFTKVTTSGSDLVRETAIGTINCQKDGTPGTPLCVYNKFNKAQTKMRFHGIWQCDLTSFGGHARFERSCYLR